MRYLHWRAKNPKGNGIKSTPYNLLFTREWMLPVPRSKEFFESISVNALGFAGALLARTPEEMDIIKKRRYGDAAPYRLFKLAIEYSAVYSPDSEFIILKHAETVFYLRAIVFHNMFNNFELFGSICIFQSQQQHATMLH